MSVNHIVIEGLPSDLQKGVSAAGKQWCRFQLNHTRRGRDESKPEIAQLRCMAFGSAASAAATARGPLIVVGRMITEGYNDKQGVPRTSLRLIAEQVLPVDAWIAPRESVQEAPPAAPSRPMAEAPIGTGHQDEPPF